MVTIAVIGILAAIAAPSMTSMVHGGRMSGAASELTAALQLARAEAIRRNVPVTVCATDGSNSTSTDCNDSTTWAKWATINRSESTTLADRILRNEVTPQGVQISGPARIVFRPSGLIDAQQTVNICTASGRRVLTVMISGVVSAANDNGAC